MFDVDRMIQCIKQSPAIWKVGSRQYNDRQLRERCWDVIAYKLIYNWSELSNEGKEDIVTAMKTKWRNIRDGYMEFVVSGGRDRGNLKRKYAYSDVLTFLRQLIVNRRPMDRGARRQCRREQYPIDIVFGIDKSTQTASNLFRHPGFKVRYKTPYNATPNHKNESMSLNYELKKLNLESDKMFLLSLLPDYCMLSYQKRIDFRLSIMNFFRNANEIRDETPTNLQMSYCPYCPCVKEAENHEVKQDQSDSQQPTWDIQSVSCIF